MIKLELREKQNQKQFLVFRKPSAKETIKKVEEYLTNFRNGELEKAEQNLKSIPHENDPLSNFSELMLSRLNDLKSKVLPKRLGWSLYSRN